ncbi:MAG: hypothetical protein BCS36_07980 [Desulfovibrio sp. MES5]|nr:MAG: hypothetical protein BCS36_07980 [Desulfovibrio sp. MES5]
MCLRLFAGAHQGAAWKRNGAGRADRGFAVWRTVRMPSLFPHGQFARHEAANESRPTRAGDSFCLFPTCGAQARLHAIMRMRRWQASFTGWFFHF